MTGAVSPVSHFTDGEPETGGLRARPRPQGGAGAGHVPLVTMTQEVMVLSTVHRPGNRGTEMRHNRLSRLEGKNK